MFWVLLLLFNFSMFLYYLFLNQLLPTGVIRGVAFLATLFANHRVFLVIWTLTFCFKYVFSHKEQLIGNYDREQEIDIVFNNLI